MNHPLQTSGEGDLKQIDIIKIYSNKRCLVIDDFPEIRGSLTRMLKTFGASTVDTAANGEEAIKLCSKKRYDIVLCDYNLGAGKDGQQILEEVRFLRVLLMTSLFVMITGESSREMVLGALECQPDDYITKPYTQQSLQMRLNRAIIRHEALLHIKKAISAGDYQTALDYCNKMITEGSRFASDCLKMKGHLHFLLKQLIEATHVYESVLGKKPLIWAKLGMAKTQISLNNLDAAEEVLESVLAEDSRYIEAHDLLADIYEKRNDFMGSQHSTENATRISPKAVLRHRRLAALADRNNDDEVTLRSHQQAIKWGLNSCHESEQDYFNYSRKVSDIVKGSDTSEAKALAANATKVLDRARKRYTDRPEVAVQAQFVDAQLLQSRGEENKARESIDKARAMYNNLATPPLESSLEYARTLHALNDEDDARELLTQLAARYENDTEVMSVIDGITGEPISEAGKKVAAKLTREGINSYEEKSFDTAIQVFIEALVTYPKHIGLNLNLVQALIAQSEANGYEPQFEKLCRRCLRSIGSIPPNHKQFKRYDFLLKQLKTHYPNALS
ncbi:response regulator [Teredinibacter waterburyi]|uniref:response regulator n=1 Tax=Teredinibacter waterburyi TaxID=1500538 RepID=UPI00165EEFBE|nr:response regulator [Teredinibacter waterburyi]